MSGRERGRAKSELVYPGANPLKPARNPILSSQLGAKSIIISILQVFGEFLQVGTLELGGKSRAHVLRGSKGLL